MTRPMSLLNVRPARRRSLPEEVTSQLIELIAAASDTEVTLPSERDLGERLGVSRNVLREALAGLQHVNVIETRGKRRVATPARARTMLVRRSSGDDEPIGLDSVTEVRRLLEPEVAALAAERATSSTITEIARWNELMADAHERGEKVIEYDSAFHIAIARAAANPMLIEVVGLLADAYSEGRERSFSPKGAVEDALEEHRKLIHALRAREPAQARNAMRRHLKHVARRIQESTVAHERVAQGSLEGR